MRVQNAAYVFACDQFGEFVFERHPDFGARFTQFRRDEREAYILVDAFFGLGREDAVFSAVA